MPTIDEIDLIRRRTGLGYRAATELLAEADGDVVEALALFEERNKTLSERIQVRGDELVKKVMDLVRQGNVTRIKIRQSDRILLEFPVTVGVVGVVLAPLLAAVGVIAAMVTQTTIEVERKPGEQTREDREE